MKYSRKEVAMAGEKKASKENQVNKLAPFGARYDTTGRLPCGSARGLRFALTPCTPKALGSLCQEHRV
jgi:hypothetical protein